VITKKGFARTQLANPFLISAILALKEQNDFPSLDGRGLRGGCL
jgi:hypothetical protein